MKKHKDLLTEHVKTDLATAHIKYGIGFRLFGDDVIVMGECVRDSLFKKENYKGNGGFADEYGSVKDLWDKIVEDNPYYGKLKQSYSDFSLTVLSLGNVTVNKDGKKKEINAQMTYLGDMYADDVHRRSGWYANCPPDDMRTLMANNTEMYQDAVEYESKNYSLY